MVITLFYYPYWVAKFYICKFGNDVVEWHNPYAIYTLNTTGQRRASNKHNVQIKDTTMDWYIRVCLQNEIQERVLYSAQQI